mgnify:CR=1 FL=1
MINIFKGNDAFTSIEEATTVLNELQDDVLEVQFPDTRRGLSKSRNDVNNRCKKFLQRCKLMQMRTEGSEESVHWADLGNLSNKVHRTLVNTKDAINSAFEQTW